MQTGDEIYSRLCRYCSSITFITHIIQNMPWAPVCVFWTLAKSCRSVMGQARWSLSCKLHSVTERYPIIFPFTSDPFRNVKKYLKAGRWEIPVLAENERKCNSSYIALFTLTDSVKWIQLEVWRAQTFQKAVLRIIWSPVTCSIMVAFFEKYSHKWKQKMNDRGDFVLFFSYEVLFPFLAAE